MVIRNELFKDVVTTSNVDGNVLLFDLAHAGFGTDKIHLFSNPNDRNSDILLNNKLIHSLIECITFSWNKLNWSSLPKELIALSFDLFLVKFFTSWRFLLNNLLRSDDSSSEFFKNSLWFFNDAQSILFSILVMLNSFLLDSVLLVFQVFHFPNVIVTLDLESFFGHF